MEAIKKRSKLDFFIDGPGGTGKTYLYKALLTNIRKYGKIAIAVASSGIAATGLPGERTAHSRFKSLLSQRPGSSCRIDLEDDHAEFMRFKVIV
ncbi:hypothetical protein LIER_29880 [Lithospermum erythrorhizon]|uniref:ATP-dependent DNA helicase n=1 Tax=Lithospermum erythrorhizon TaxID=34254 RepID=A0AAV3RNZ2_LITER